MSSLLTQIKEVIKNIRCSIADISCRVEKISADDIEDLDEFKIWLKEKDRADQEKRKKLLNKVVFCKGNVQKAGRELRYWSCFVPRREYWKKLSQTVGIDETESSDGTTLDDTQKVGFGGGFETSTKGMQTGIWIELKPGGAAGYLPNFFMIIDDPSLNFDIGRQICAWQTAGYVEGNRF